MFCLHEKPGSSSDLNLAEASTLSEGVRRATETFNESFALQALSRVVDFIRANDRRLESVSKSSLYLPRLLSLYMESRKVIEKALELTCLLATSQENALALGKSCCDLLVTVLRTYISHPNVIQWGCKCVKLLAEAEANVPHFSKNESCDALTAILEAYGASDETIAEWGCKAIFILSRRSEKMQMRFGMRTCRLIVENILKSEVHKNSIIVKASVTAAVGALAYENSANRRYFMDSGACWIILKLLELSYAVGPDYVTTCAYCICNVAEGDSNWQYQFHNWGAVSTLLKAVQTHSDISHVCVQCFRALRSLSHDSVLVREELISLRGCDVIVQTLRKHTNHVSAMEWGFSLVSSLADYRPTFQSLHHAGIFECLVEAFRR